jgi:hypothetical protein
VAVIYPGSTRPNAWEVSHPRLVHWGGAAVAAFVCAAIVGLLYLLLSIGR